MTTSKAQIFNITLNILGVSTPIESANSQDNKAILLNNYYEMARNYVLKDFDWNFASSFKKLSNIQHKEENQKYKYTFAYPNDCICARDIFEHGNYELKKFSIGMSQDNIKIIMTDVEQPILRYTKLIDKEIYFSSEFAMALSHYLASLTANVITGSIQKGELAYEKYKQILKRAKLLNAQEGAENLYEDTTYLDSRG